MRQRRIVKVQPAISAEHRNTFLQGVQRFALHAVEGVEAPLQIIGLRHIVIKIGDTALRIGIGDHPQRAAIGQKP